MLRTLFIGNSMPYSFPIDPNANFLPGMAAQLTLFGNQVVCGVSDGTAPLGIIDDIKTVSFSSVSIDEIVIAPVTGVMSNGILVAPTDVTKALDNPHILEGSFVSNPVDVEVNYKNGLVTFIAGTPLNFSMTGGRTYDSIRTVVSYSYQVPNRPGDDSTQGTKRITVWLQRMVFATDQFETNQRYPLNSPVFVNESGLFTTRQIQSNYPAIGMVLAPPTSIHSSLEMLWF